MSSLDWVRIKAQIMGPAHLIDYVEFALILDKEVGGQHNYRVHETEHIRMLCLWW